MRSCIAISVQIMATVMYAHIIHKQAHAFTLSYAHKITDQTLMNGSGAVRTGVIDWSTNPYVFTDLIKM